MQIGERVGKYVVESELGHGGMGVVYRARHATLERTVALKVLSPRLAPDSSARRRFVREAQAIARLNHPGIVQIFDIEEQGELCYLVMEFVDGESLDDLLRRTPLSFARSARIGADIAAALHFAHERGVVHRDVKPANILLTHERVVKVADFGLAHLLDREMGLTKTGMVVGSPQYMCPEQCQGHPVDQRADVYALGIVLFKMLTGTVPYTAPNSIGILMAHVQEPVPDPLKRNPEVPPALAEVVVRSMQKEPSARYSTMREVQAALLAYLGERVPEDHRSWVRKKSGPVAPMAAPEPSPAPAVSAAPPPEAAPDASATTVLPAGEETPTVEVSETTGPAPATEAIPRSRAERPRREPAAAPPAPKRSRSGWIPGTLAGAAAAALAVAWLGKLGPFAPTQVAPAPTAVAAPSPAPSPTPPPEPSPQAVPSPSGPATGAGEVPITVQELATPAVPPPSPGASPAPLPTVTAAGSTPPTPTPKSVSVALPAGDAAPPPPKGSPFCGDEGPLLVSRPSSVPPESLGLDYRKVRLRLDLDPEYPKPGDPFSVRVTVVNGGAAPLQIERVVEEPASGGEPFRGAPDVKLPLILPPDGSRLVGSFGVTLAEGARTTRGLRAFDPRGISWARTIDVRPCR